MRCMDGHCDVLYKLWKHPTQSFYSELSSLDVTYHMLVESEIYMQTFAIYVPPDVPRHQMLYVALKQIDLFYSKVISKDLTLIISNEDIEELEKPRALLALEGADAISGDLCNLRILWRLGLRQVGLTWNYANEVSDGILENRGAGLSNFGYLFLQEMKKLGMIVDVSHLSIQGFWDVINVDIPVLASHSNTREHCGHVRNLENNQIQALIEKDGLIGITFVPAFVATHEPCIDDLLLHIDHICMLGGENHIYFGSDFDGITDKIPYLEKANQLHNLKDALLKRYKEPLVRKWMWENGMSFYSKYL